MSRPKPEMGGYNDPDMMRAAERRRREHGECDATIARLTGFAMGILGVDADLSQINETTGRQVADQWQVDWDRAGQLEADNARLTRERDDMKRHHEQSCDVWVSEMQHWKARAEAAEAERDRLRRWQREGVGMNWCEEHGQMRHPDCDECQGFAQSTNQPGVSKSGEQIDTCKHVDDGTGLGICHFCGGNIEAMQDRETIARLTRERDEAMRVLQGWWDSDAACLPGPSVNGRYPDGAYPPTPQQANAAFRHFVAGLCACRYPSGRGEGNEEPESECLHHAKVRHRAEAAEARADALVSELARVSDLAVERVKAVQAERDRLLRWQSTAMDMLYLLPDQPRARRLIAEAEGKEGPLVPCDMAEFAPDDEGKEG